ncbi:MAG: extracellular solute-binding protein [Patescibacteria group bacterium]
MKLNLQIIFIAIFIIAAIFGVLVFSGIIPLGNSDNTGAQGTVVLWGTAKTESVAKALEDFNRLNKNFTVKYIQKFPETFDQDLLEALASGVGPDIFFLTEDLAYKYSNKIYTIPYQSFPLSSFKNTFVGAGEIFLTSKGILAFPISVDPLMMYYNRSILDANSVVYPPTYWDEIAGLVPIMTKKDDTGKITQSTVAMGQFSNITHAKDIITTLFMQAGNPIVSEKNGIFSSVLGDSSGKYNLGNTLKFYTNFADPLQSVYSWNKSLANSKDAFSAEKLAFYFGYASELQLLVNKNPNQNFLVAPMPQIRNSSFKLTSAHILGVAISAFSKNFNTAFTAASLLTTGDFASQFAQATATMPARRDLLAIKKTDSFSPIFYSSALYAKSWLDPSSSDTDNIFRIMVDNVLSNNMSTEITVKDANSKLNLLFIK